MESVVLQRLALGRRDAAFEELLNLYEGKVYHLALSIVGSATLAKDISQDVFLKVWQGLDSYDPRLAALGTWIYTITRNTALSRLRSDAYRAAVPIDSIAEPAAPPTPETADLRNAVGKLPPELRQVIALYYYQERAVDEVAEMLNLRPGTVKSHLFRARKMLAEIMEGAAKS